MQSSSTHPLTVPTEISAFASRLIRWHHQHGRHDLPWQGTRDPYRVWLSEVMLQQTQVASVIPYYQRFLERYATVDALAAAPVEEVMELWSGLGYYARARNLHRCAQTIMNEYGGRFPRSPDTLATLPGIGRSTANAIADFCFDACVPILDGNVKRVLTRCYGIGGFPGDTATEKELWTLAQALLPTRTSDTGIYIQAQMDLGATLCTRSKPACPHCPLKDSCIARREGRTAELPAKKTRKPLPQRQSTVLLLRNGDSWLLERRPPAGIWGGMLSLPETGENEDPVKAVHRLGFSLDTGRHDDDKNRGSPPFTPMPPLRHTFTHFQLTLYPLIATAHPQPGIAENTGLCLLTTEELTRSALPSPIRKILAAAGELIQENPG